MTTSPISALLKNKQELYQAINQPHHWNWVASQLILTSLLGLSFFGLVLGTFVSDWHHWLATSWKIIVLVWGPIALCTPALFVFSSIRGSRLKLTELVYLLVGALATSGIVLAALTPLTWFFTWTTSTPEFVQGMNGFFIGLSLLFGMYYLGQGMLQVYKAQKEKYPQSSAALEIVFLWFVLLLVVVVQMSQKLGPWYQ